MDYNAHLSQLLAMLSKGSPGGGVQPTQNIDPSNYNLPANTLQTLAEMAGGRGSIGMSNAIEGGFPVSAFQSAVGQGVNSDQSAALYQLLTQVFRGMR